MTQDGRPASGAVLRNTLWLMLAQVVGMPISLLVNGLMGRTLGPEEFGDFYLAGTLTTFGFLVVEWGQSLALPAMVVRDRARAGELLGSALTWRIVAAIAVYVMLAAAAVPLGKPSGFQVVLLLMVLVAALVSCCSACQLTAQGFERTDFSAISAMGSQAMNVLLVIPTLLVGGRLRSMLIAQAAGWVIMLAAILRFIRRVGVGALSVRRATMAALLRQGFPFMFIGLASTLQPVVDATMLAKFAPEETVGWFAASQKLVGLLIFPAAALIGALYPILCRLHGESQDEFFHTARTALRTATLLVVPIAMGCLSYPEIGIAIFSRDSYGPAEDNLRVISGFVFLVYFTMVIGICLSALGKQRAWAATQCLCVLISLVLGPILIPWFQAHRGNGGIGVCVAADVSETVMLLAGIALLPRGFFDRTIVRSFGTSAAAGGAMAVVAWLLNGFNPFLAAPVAVAAYAAALWVLGGVDAEQLATVRAIVIRKRNR